MSGLDILLRNDIQKILIAQNFHEITSPCVFLVEEFVSSIVHVHFYSRRVQCLGTERGGGVCNPELMLVLFFPQSLHRVSSST